MSAREESGLAACRLCMSRGGFRAVYTDLGIEIVRCNNCKFVFQLRSDDVTSSDYKGREAYSHEKVRSLTDVISEVRRLKPTGRLLDVGSGRGEFIDTMRAEGYDVVGVEPDETGYRIATQELHLNVVRGYYTRDLFPENSFDVVTCVQTLEHLTDPKKALRASHYHLRNGGLLVVAVPSFNNPRVLAYRATRIRRFVKTDFIRSHLSYFTRASLRRLVEEADFRVIKISCGRYSTRYGWGGPLLKPLDLLANRLGIGGIALYADKVR